MARMALGGSSDPARRRKAVEAYGDAARRAHELPNSPTRRENLRRAKAVLDSMQIKYND